MVAQKKVHKVSTVFIILRKRFRSVRLPQSIGLFHNSHFLKKSCRVCTGVKITSNKRLILLH